MYFEAVTQHLPLDPIISLFNPGNNPTAYFSKIHFNVIISS